MWTSARILAAAIACLTLAAAETASAEAWPTRAIRIVVSTPPGGITDAFARAYGDYISQKLGQPVIVENKTGASGALAAQLVKDSSPDGYTLMYTISSTLLGNRLLLKSLAYDPDKDFTIVAMTPSGHLPLVVHSAANAKTLEEFVAYARRNKVTAGSYGIGSFAHIAIAELNRQFGLDISIVHYRGEAPMWQDFAAGVIQAAVGSYQAALPVLDTGVGRPIAVPTPVRMKKLPETRTFVEQGVTGNVFQLTSFTALVAPAATPADRIDLLAKLMVEGGKTERVQKLLEAFGVDSPAMDRASSVALYAKEGPVWLESIKTLGLEPQ
ncbi:tripartite tricarboxylate transporter substrate binding protein [Bradyrhizobium hipponense]|uniref:Tripartite tricarboxylate transporter substrate binding protein n=1 Tax=Bradyrhizobium hipponense TaxID=2605638 RepID=A0A5S4YEU9_9BRAD|nr:tripartite tricarboxylate transporter substrate binding protein [Bradyrhizobium hipponense]TYO62007.1 tripartite tricarboxylate transporter substrate binding protein [Bradyrhizobium hipponense]